MIPARRPAGIRLELGRLVAMRPVLQIEVQVVGTGEDLALVYTDGRLRRPARTARRGGISSG
jgi:hypothetical protein